MPLLFFLVQIKNPFQITANGQSICEGMELKLLQLHLCFVVDYCFVAER
jgi:hypothetical protein